MTVLDEDTLLGELLAPLGRVSPVTLPTSRRKRRKLVSSVVVGTAFLGCGVAFATGLNPLAGISAARTPANHGNVLPAAVEAQIEKRAALLEQEQNRVAARLGLPRTAVPGRIVISSARLLASPRPGTTIYVAATTNGNTLAVIVAQRSHGKLDVGLSLGPPLSENKPTTDELVGGPVGSPPISFGIAQDRVSAVSFRAHGREQTVPVEDNVWFYEGSSAALTSITVHYTDGATKTLTH